MQTKRTSLHNCRRVKFHRCCSIQTSNTQVCLQIGSMYSLKGPRAEINTLVAQLISWYIPSPIIITIVKGYNPYQITNFVGAQILLRCSGIVQTRTSFNHPFDDCPLQVGISKARAWTDPTPGLPHGKTQEVTIKLAMTITLKPEEIISKY